MNISVEKLLFKIEEELKHAKGSQTDSKIRERIRTVKALCELILDEEPSEVKSQSLPLPSSPIQPKKMVIDKEANGDSLFDF